MQQSQRPTDARLRFSVVIPTYQRRDLVVLSVQALARQEFAGGFEVIVVVDGSSDGSADALRRLSIPFPLIVVEQPNRGSAATRNRGADAAAGEIRRFLDDDMESHPRLLAEHDRSHREGAEVVLGHIPLHPELPSNILTLAVGRWADDRARQLAGPHVQLTLNDLLGGQLSIRASLFHEIGDFDAVNFTRGGSFGDEDADFGYRLLSQGHRIIFNPDAISWQKYVVGPRHHLRQWRQAGRADVAFARKHPEQAAQIFALRGAGKRINRWLWRPLAAWPRLTAPLLAGFKELAVGLVERGCRDRIAPDSSSKSDWLNIGGACMRGGIPASRVLRVLAYHAIADLHGASILEPYGVPPDDFRDQLDLLQRYGFHFISADEFLRFVDGSAGLPRRALLLTFDDCFEDLTRVVLPMLQERAIPALAFAVSARLGRTNEWDKPWVDCTPVVDGGELAQLQEAGI